jgi:uncharacterized OB-fold protein
MNDEPPGPIPPRAQDDQLETTSRNGVRLTPIPDEVTRPYWESAKRGELRIQRCRRCGTFQHPPAARCAECWSDDAEWVLLSGQGTIYSFIIDYRLMLPGFDAPYIVVQVVPDDVPSDCVRIVANLRGVGASAVHIGMQVRVEFEVVSPECTLPQFRPTLPEESVQRGSNS